MYKSGRSICKYQGPGITPFGLTLFCLHVYRWSEGGRALLCYFFPALPFGSFGVVWPGVQNSVKMQFFIGHAREPLFCSPYCLNKRRKRQARASVNSEFTHCDVTLAAVVLSIQFSTSATTKRFLFSLSRFWLFSHRAHVLDTVSAAGIRGNPAALPYTQGYIYLHNNFVYPESNWRLNKSLE